jgi:pimeloyl-ACP methyl ester carboxylesterase
MTSGSSSSADFSLPGLPTLQTAKVFGRALRYYDFGRGPPLVLLHGVGGDADQWAFVFEALAAKHRIIAIDLPGFGRSDKPPIDYCVEVYVEFLDRFLAAIGVARASLLGHSFGGWIVAAFALAFPHRVERLVLVDSAGIDAGSAPLPIDLNVSSRRNMRAVFEYMFHDPRMVSDALVDLAYSLHLERGDGATVRSLLAALSGPREKLDGKLGALTAPTLLLWGEQDRLTPLSMAQQFARAIPGAQLRVIAQCGHLPPIEKPEEFAAAVLAFLGG